MVISFYAGIFALFYVGLSFYVIRGRFQNRVSIGDGGNDLMSRRIRIHANFIEYVPLALILIFFVEVADVSEWFVHLLLLTLLLGRILHPIGTITKEAPGIFRMVGMIMTFLVIIIAALINIFVFLF